MTPARLAYAIAVDDPSLDVRGPDDEAGLIADARWSGLSTFTPGTPER